MAMPDPFRVHVGISQRVCYSLGYYTRIQGILYDMTDMVNQLFFDEAPDPPDSLEHLLFFGCPYRGHPPSPASSFPLAKVPEGL